MSSDDISIVLIKVVPMPDTPIVDVERQEWFAMLGQRLYETRVREMGLVPYERWTPREHRRKLL